MSKKHPLDIEATFSQLDATVSKLESEKTDLQSSLKAFEHGVKLIKQAQAELQDASQRVNLLLEDGETGKSTPFKDDSSE